MMDESLSAKEQRKRSNEIDKLLRQEARKLAKETRLLVIGPGQSGKSTFCKQLKILHLSGFSENEKQNFKAVIHTNIIDATLDLIAAAHNNSLSFADSNTDTIARKLYDDFRVQNNVHSEVIELANMHVKTYQVDKALAANIKSIWQDANTNSIIESTKPPLGEGIPSYVERIDQIISHDYVPDNDDILYARLRTTAVSETLFHHGGVHFRVIDVGGQKGERSKWLPLFSDVTAIIFCVAASDYDLVLEEDGVTNRMVDSLNLFKQIARDKNLRDRPILLFLNKKDVFEKKILEVDLGQYFPEYKGGKNYSKGIDFLEGLFRKEAGPRKGEIFVHVTQATDTRNIEVVWQAVKSIFIKGVMDDLGGFGGSV